jgi:hypothetical protein
LELNPNCDISLLTPENYNSFLIEQNTAFEKEMLIEFVLFVSKIAFYSIILKQIFPNSSGF